ncbi:MAG: ammonia channel protein, partial [Pirellulaceae bacterium]|nr:ammonia channel protein [Pirellulaceae bacterium]
MRHHFLVALLTCLLCCLVGADSLVAQAVDEASADEASADAAGEAGDEGGDVPVPEPVVADAETANVRARVNEMEVQLKQAQLAGNNAWMLTSSALVLFMTAPGLAFFYSGLVRRKNVLGVMMQCLFLMGIMTIVWGLWGYSLAFGDGIALFGGGSVVG